MEGELIRISTRPEYSDPECIEIIRLKDRYQDSTNALEALLEEWERSAQ